MMHTHDLFSSDFKLSSVIIIMITFFSAATDRERSSNFVEDTFVLKNMNACSQIDISTSTTEKSSDHDGGIPPMGRSVEWSANLRSQAMEVKKTEDSPVDSSKPSVDSNNSSVDEGLSEEPLGSKSEEVHLIEKKKIYVDEEDTSWF